MQTTPQGLRLGGGEPLHNLVLNSARTLADEATRVLELADDAGAAASRLRRARDLLASLSERGDLPAAELRRELTPLIRENRDAETDIAMAAFWGDVARYGQDLTYASWVETGGIAAVNAHLDQALQRLRASGADYGMQREAVGQINDVLRRAIYIFPHLAGTVTIEAALDETDFETRVAQYIGGPQANRVELLEVWRASGAPQREQATLLHLSLPYLFSAEGSIAQRRARRDSWEDVAFVGRRKWRRAEVSDVGSAAEVELPPLVLVRTAYDRDLGMSRIAMLLAREVRRVALTNEPQRLKARSAKFAESEPRSRLDALTHYLLFRDFGDIGQNPRLARGLDIPELAQVSLFEPEYATGLLDIGDEPGLRQWLERGFGYLALLGRGHAAAQLLRFENVEIRYDEHTRQTARHSPLQIALYRAALRPEDALRRRATVFEGEAIIAELMQTPVAPRHFRDA